MAPRINPHLEQNSQCFIKCLKWIETMQEMMRKKQHHNTNTITHTLTVRKKEEWDVKKKKTNLFVFWLTWGWETYWCISLNGDNVLPITTCFPTKEIRSFPGDNKIGDKKKLKSYISGTKYFIPFHFRNTNNIFDLRLFPPPKCWGNMLWRSLFIRLQKEVFFQLRWHCLPWSYITRQHRATGLLSIPPIEWLAVWNSSPR